MDVIAVVVVLDASLDCSDVAVVAVAVPVLQLQLL